MGLFKNLSLLFSDSLLVRMTELERRQELLEDYTDQKLDSMKSYAARVGKRDRDALKQEKPDAVMVDPRVDRILSRRARRNGALA